jgi:zinc D-Ala-D-Ala carboxypeptidase
MNADHLSPNFTLAEFEHSDKANRLGIYNKIGNSAILESAMHTCWMLEKIRKFLTVHRGREVPINITSGYRCPELNRATTGAMISSDHMKGAAADWVAPVFGNTSLIVSVIAPVVDDLGIGQMILEYPKTEDSWIHTSTIRPMISANRVLVHTDEGYTPWSVN